MVGRRAAQPEHRGVDRHRPGAARGRGTSALDDAAGRALLDDINLTIHAGEVLGIAGVEGNGQTELVEASSACASPTPAPSSARRRGRHALGHPRAPRGRRRLHPRGPAAARSAAGRAAVGEPHPRATRPGRPRAKGLDQPRRRPRGHRAHRRASTTSARPGIDTTARALSGGNQQKFIVGREMSGDPVLLIASHPTRGVDVGAQAAIWDHIREARRGPGGAADLGRPRRADRPVRHDPR